MPSRWFGTMCCVRANQKAERPVRTRPLSGISVGSTTSNTEILSLATSRSRSSSSLKISRTLPLATCWATSGMDGLLLSDERVETLEDGVDVTGERGEVERRVERVPAERGGDLRILADELAEVALLLPRAHRAALREPVGLVARQPGRDEREEDALAEEQAVARLEVAQHPPGEDA